MSRPDSWLENAIIFGVYPGSGGGGVTPGGTNTQIQYNNAGVFGGDSGFVTDGSGNVDITGSLDVDNININGNTIISTNTNGDLELVPNALGRLRLGGSVSSVTQQPNTTIFNIAKDSSSSAIYSASYFNNASTAPLYVSQKSRSTTVGVFSAVGSNDVLSYMNFTGDDGSSFRSAASFRARVDGNVSPNIVPGRFEWHTQNSSGTLTLGMTLNSSQNLIVAGSIAPNEISGIIATKTNNSPNAGSVGELVSSTIANASAVAITSTIPANLTSISLTAGDWDLFGNVTMSPSTSASLMFCWISTTSATLPDPSLYNVIQGSAGTLGLIGLNAPSTPLKLSATTTVYISCSATFVGTGKISGSIFARRRR